MHDGVGLFSHPAPSSIETSKGGREMLRELFETLIQLLPVFALLGMMFGAGFFIGRVSKKSDG